MVTSIIKQTTWAFASIEKTVGEIIEGTFPLREDYDCVRGRFNTSYQLEASLHSIYILKLLKLLRMEL